MTQQQWEKIYALSFSPVYKYILRLSGDPQEAEEITAETFLRAMESETRFRGEASVTTWLCAIARNLWLSRLREQRRFVDFDQLPEVSGPDPEEQMLEKDATEGIFRVLRELQDTYREVFLLRAVAGLSFRQVGAMFGKSENWACVTYHRAKQQIKTRMEESQ